MTQKEITIAGKTYTLAFNFAAVCYIEEATGKPFDLSIFETRKTSELLTLIWSALKANNDQCPTLDDFCRQVSVEEFTACNESLAPLIAEFFGVHLQSDHATPSEEQEPQDP